jgi:hypothetical protein
MNNLYLFTIYEHKYFDILMRLISTENGYCLLRSGCWTWFGSHQDFAALFQLAKPIQEQRKPKQ